ncbi:DUF3168 domain-containing protein [Xanthobacteraceae bacterium A53D]
MGPSEALHLAIRDRLVADAAVAALLGNRIYDHVPATAGYPYAEFGEFQELEDASDCIEGSEIYVTFHAWSQVEGTTEAKRIAAAIKKALGDGDALTLAPDHRLVEFAVQSSRVLDDPDGETSHVVMTFRALTEPV